MPSEECGSAFVKYEHSVTQTWPCLMASSGSAMPRALLPYGSSRCLLRGAQAAQELGEGLLQVLWHGPTPPEDARKLYEEARATLERTLSTYTVHRSSKPAKDSGIRDRV